MLSFLFLPVRPGSDQQSTKRPAKHENMQRGLHTGHRQAVPDWKQSHKLTLPCPWVCVFVGCPAEEESRRQSQRLLPTTRFGRQRSITSSVQRVAVAMGQTRVLQSNATILSDVMADDLDLGVINFMNQMFQITVLHFKM